ncbi:MAG TPA: PKD domain-containing protein, partial [Thermoplasmata archaeon]|nr:PKD domain-containing protein [Thermoplasmata archaeon]
NVTWDFDDGTISYANIVNHTFETDGDYNVTLTVKDSANNTDVDYA